MFLTVQNSPRREAVLIARSTRLSGKIAVVVTDFMEMFKLRKWRQGFGLLVAASMAIALWLSPAAARSSLNDIGGYWAQPCIEELAQKRIINGYPDGSFKPNSAVTRAEFAAMLQTAFPNTAAVREGGEFADVPGNHWAGGAIRGAFKKGFLSGYPGGVFKPNEKIPRVQAIASLASGLKYAPAATAGDTLQAVFADAAAIPDYAKNAIAAATENSLVVNYPNVKTLNPNQPVKRAEVAAFLCQALGISGGVPSQYIAKTPISPEISAGISSEIRGVWLTNIDSEVLFSTPGVANAIARLAQMNFNTVYPTVWNWGYTLYPSKVAEREIGRAVRLVPPLDASLDLDLGVKGRDMLREIVEQGHQKGMAVIPWFEFGFMAPADSELAKRHPDWLTTRRDGSKIWKEGTHERVWLNPFHPEVQQFVLDLVAEIVSNYDVDGIQFDDHFGLPAEFGYDPLTVGMYQQEIGQPPSDNFQETFWVRWRADKLNEFMERIFQTVKARQSDCIVSLSPNPLHFSLPAHLQDWFTWERKGFVEEIILQVYRSDLKRFATELERTEVQLAKSHIPVGVGILTGLKGRSIPLTQIQEQVKATRDRNLAGVSFFFYESLSNWAVEKPAEREAAFKRLFPAPVERPNILQGWKPSA